MVAVTEQTGWINVVGTRLETCRWSTEHSNGLPILLLHEGLGSIRLWKDFPEKLALASRREVIAWSRDGHGWSDWADSAYAPDFVHRQAMLLPQLHRALGIERAHWLGHSDGGSIALIGANRSPGLVASLILEAPHVFVEELTVKSIVATSTRFSDPNTLDRMARYQADPQRTFRRWKDVWLDPGFRDWNIEAELTGIDCPTLLLQGREDQYGTMEQLDRISAVLTQAERVELPNCGHSPHLASETKVLDAICAFLRSKE